MSEMDELLSAEAAYRAADAAVQMARARRDDAARAAHAAGYRPGKIADVLGVSRGRVTQIVGAKPHAAPQNGGKP